MSESREPACKSHEPDASAVMPRVSSAASEPAAAAAVPGDSWDQGAFNDDGPRRGLAIIALALAVVGLMPCVPLVGIAGLLLGGFALFRSIRWPDEFGGRGLAMAGVLIGAVSLFTGPSKLLAVWSGSGQWAQRGVCMKNMNRIGRALRAYAANNLHWYPQSLDVLTARGSITGELAECPTDAGDGQGEIIYVPGLTTFSPPDWILLFERLDNHGDGANVYYTGGYLEFLNPEDYRRELARVRKEIDELRYGENPWYRAFGW